MIIKGFVCCDCFEKEKIAVAPEFLELIQIDLDGSRIMLAENEEQEFLFEEWQINACEHTKGILVEHLLIANEDELMILQDIFSEITENEDFDCPVIYEHLLYNEQTDVHDFISTEELISLIDEMKNLQPFLEALNNQIFTIFFQKLSQLLIQAAKIQKPIGLTLN